MNFKLLHGLHGAGLAALITVSCSKAGGDEAALHAPPLALAQTPSSQGEPESFQVPPPPFSDEDIFPCSECHDPEMMDPNPERRELSLAHDEIELKHDEEHRWCLDCHDTDDRDKLHLASGELVPFEESYRLCGQCHGDKYRDWRVGVHGRRTGNWNGAKEYLLCVHCHNSHNPKFAPIAPEPGPVPPRRTP